MWGIGWGMQNEEQGMQNEEQGMKNFELIEFKLDENLSHSNFNLHSHSRIVG